MQTVKNRALLPITILTGAFLTLLVALCMAVTPTKAMAEEIDTTANYGYYENVGCYVDSNGVTFDYNGISNNYYTTSALPQTVTVYVNGHLYDRVIDIHGTSGGQVSATTSLLGDTTIKVTITPHNVPVNQAVSETWIMLEGDTAGDAHFHAVIPVVFNYSRASYNTSLTVNPTSLSFNYTGTQSDYSWTSGAATVTVTGSGLDNIAVDTSAGYPVNAVKIGAVTKTGTNTWTFTVTPNLLPTSNAQITVTGIVGNAYTGNYYYDPTITKTIWITFNNVTANTPVSFSDVPSNAWYANDVKTAVQHGILQGWKNSAGQNVFGPDYDLTRAEAAVILWRFADPSAAAKGGAVNNTTPWTDVASGQFYTAAMNWAYSNGLMADFTTSEAKPNEPINREDLCVMLYKLATQKYGVSTAGNSAASYANATNQGSIASYAQPAVGWAYYNKIMTGFQPNNDLAGNALVTRAQAAKMFVLTLGNLIGWDKSGK